MIRFLYLIFIIYYILLGIFSIDFAKFQIINLGIPILPTELLIIVWLIYLFVNKNKTYPSIGLTLTICLYVLLRVIFIILNGDFNLLAIRIIVPFFYIILSYVTYDVVRYNLSIKKLYKINLFATSFAFLFTIGNIVLGIKPISTNYSTSTEGVYYLYQGSFGVFFIQFFLSFSRYLEKKQYKDLVIMGIVIIWILFFALHRSAVLAILIPLIFIYNKDLKTKFFKFSLLILSILIFILLFANISLGSELTGIINRLLDTGNTDETNAYWRLMMWNNAITQFINNPFLIVWGVGFKFYDFELTNEILFDLRKAPFEGFHNSWLFIVFRLGIIGLFIMVLFFYKGLKSIKQNKLSDVKPIIASLFAMFIFAFFNVVFENPYNGFYLWFLIGWIYAENSKNLDLINVKKLN
jgi:O-antigen ligase